MENAQNIPNRVGGHNMSYRINYRMAKQLLRSYIEQAYEKGPIVLTKKELCEKQDTRELVQQLSSNGCDVDSLIRQLKEAISKKKYRYTKIRVNVDGAARFNNDPAVPNNSAAGYAVFADGELINKDAKYIGSHATLPQIENNKEKMEEMIVPASNNTTEYLALIYALEYLVESGLNAKEIEIHSDSRMVVTQVNMVSTTKAPHLRRLRDYAHELMSNFANVSLVLIPREENEYADSLVNNLLDSVEAEKEKIAK